MTFGAQFLTLVFSSFTTFVSTLISSLFTNILNPLFASIGGIFGATP
jgi:hypothetical protein